MSGLLNSSLNGSTSNLQDSNGRSFATSFSAQSGAASPVFHHSGSIQGLHNIHGSFNVPNMPGTLASRNSTINSVPSGGVQQPTGNLSSGRYASNSLPVALSQISHGSSHGHSGVANRGGISVVGSPGYSSSTNGVGGSIPGILPTSAAIANRSAVPGLGVSPILGNAGPRITSSMGNIVGGGNIGRSISSGGGLSVPGIASRLNLAANSGSGSLNVQGPNRLMSGVLQQASPQVISMLGNSYPSAGGPLSQGHVQTVNNLSSMGMLNDVNSNENSPFDINDFPQLTSRPSSSGGPQGQLGSLRKQGLGVSPIVQQNQEFSIQNEDFPALPGFKGGNADYAMDLHQKEQFHDNTVSMMQSQHFSMGRSAGFNLGGSYSSHRPQQQQQHAPAVSSSGVSFSPVNNQDLLHLHGSDIFPSSHSTYHSQTSGPPGIGLRPLNSPNTVSGMGSYDQLIQQYQQHQNQSQFRLQQMSAVSQAFRDQGMKSMQATQAAPDPFGLLGLLSVIRMSDPDLTSLALGIDLTTLGLNLNSAENLHKTFGSPWSDEPAKGDPEFSVPQCYYAKQPPALHQGYFLKFQVETLFYIFYSMPKDEAQLYAANELYNRGWFFHREHRLWFIRVANMEPLVKTNTYERGSYLCFDPNTWESVRKDNFVLYYELLEKKPPLPQH
ncbi:probable NOT transcription complex subunit VIP2 isoform X1 [Vitis riparia]|uniref:probable NOT transcription complex subunit VIP2 isoform X1 n=2 Tax=Vitis riparia TaxID=96939 RepID=UPI00155B28D6|nr:probable NOT transcription complex subunit VIP2 isoform X1 [Vitis riparia]XP_034688305.1 probable NOT transcription complex subunit VIP2 isoform X1 [Vitis riparia]XP_034688306.1 probable NOT transcription complex subunit VIP2 isoform X1 [Vitis riparia]XP_034688307.1 probable NOT transcription complex subunit VIP2 isoform X1 [Vitis riparia]XP_034688308.1 probable NOT transcription complex subunit VIP2 isoform X1 [Vitis riparia]